MTDEKLQVGDVLKYDKIWSREYNPPLWCVVHKREGKRFWVKPLNDARKLPHDQWALSGPVDVPTRIVEGVNRTRPEPSEWPDEVCTAMAERALNEGGMND